MPIRDKTPAGGGGGGGGGGGVSLSQVNSLIAGLFSAASISNQTGTITFTNQDGSTDSISLSSFVGAAIGSATGLHFTGASFDAGTSVITFTGAGGGSLLTLDLSALAGGGGGVSSLMLDSAVFTGDGISTQLSLHSDLVEDIRNAFVGASVTGTRLRFTDNQGVHHDVTLPTSGGGGLTLDQVNDAIDAAIPSARRVPAFSNADDLRFMQVKVTNGVAALEFAAQDLNGFSAVAQQGSTSILRFSRLDGNHIDIDIGPVVLPAYTAANANNILAVNSAGTALIWSAAPSGGGQGGGNDDAFTAVAVAGSSGDDRFVMRFAQADGTSEDFDLAPPIESILEATIPTSRRIPELGTPRQMVVVDAAGEGLEFSNPPASAGSGTPRDAESISPLPSWTLDSSAPYADNEVTIPLGRPLSEIEYIEFSLNTSVATAGDNILGPWRINAKTLLDSNSDIITDESQSSVNASGAFDHDILFRNLNALSGTSSSITIAYRVGQAAVSAGAPLQVTSASFNSLIVVPKGNISADDEVLTATAGENIDGSIPGDVTTGTPHTIALPSGRTLSDYKQIALMFDFNAVPASVPGSTHESVHSQCVQVPVVAIVNASEAFSTPFASRGANAFAAYVEANGVSGASTSFIVRLTDGNLARTNPGNVPVLRDGRFTAAYGVR